MAVAEDFVSGDRIERGAPRIGVSVTVIAIVASALLVYVSQAFLLTEVFGVKRPAQFFLMIPIAVAGCYYFVSRPGRLLDPLICFSIVKLVTELALRGQPSYLLDGVASIFALMVLTCAPARSFEIGARIVVAFAGIMALMALIQWVLITLDPSLVKYVFEVSDDGAVLNTIENPVALLGLHQDLDYTLFGQRVVRMQSFAKEPSLNVVYFMLPAALAFLMNTRSSRLWGGTLLAFCVLSLSGSIMLTLAFTAFWWLALHVSSIKFAVPYGMLIVMGAFLIAVKSFGLEPLVNAFEFMAQYGDFLNKGASLTDRTGGAVLNMSAALAAPFGSSTISDIPGPWLINSALAAGWLGVLMLIWFLHRLGRQLDTLHSKQRGLSVRRLGCLLLLGSLATILVFNDYQMGNYAGLILLAFIYRTIQLRNLRSAALLQRSLT
jgi:hypothetical protein